MLERKCRYCGAELPADKPENQFCGHSCSAKLSNRVRAKRAACLTCGSSISAARKYCSRGCFQTWWAGTRPRAEKKQPGLVPYAVGLLLPRTVKGRYKNGAGYFELFFTDGTRATEHRVVATRMLGRELVDGEAVHHKNGCKTDNDESNLAVMEAREHLRHHAHERAGMVESFPCSHCGTVFQKPSRFFRFKRKAGQTQFYCSRSCSGTASREQVLARQRS